MTLGCRHGYSARQQRANISAHYVDASSLSEDESTSDVSSSRGAIEGSDEALNQSTSRAAEGGRSGGAGTASMPQDFGEADLDLLQSIRDQGAAPMPYIA